MTVGVVIFDCEGVLVDSEELAVDLMDPMATAHGVPMSCGHAARAMGAAAGHCLVVEDSVPGFQAGTAPGMQVVALTEGDDRHFDPRIETCNTLCALPGVLDRGGQWVTA